MSDVKSILLVEDNPQDEALTLRSLKKINLANRIDVVRDGEQALHYLLRQGDYAHLGGTPLPAVVLLDISLPRINGLDVLARLRAEASTRLVPVVMLTSSDEERDRLKSHEIGANGFMRKPLDLAEFDQTAARLGVYWLASNEPPH